VDKGNKISVRINGFGIPKTIKKLVMAGVAAVFIGMALGYIMLRLFAGMEAPEATSTPAYQEDIDNQPAPTSENKGQEQAASDTKDDTTNSGEEGQAVAATKNTVTFPAMSAFVVQAGIFSTKDKAEIMQRSISQKGVETYVWPRDGQFYLFAGVAPSKAEGEQIATMLKANGIEVYVKEWSVAGAEKEVAKAEGEWIQNGMEGWESLIGPASALVGTGAGDITAMKNSLPSAPDTISEQATPFQQSVKQYASVLQTYEAEQSEATSWEIQVSLLDMWHGYEQYVQ